jgi:hypothetical protein
MGKKHRRPQKPSPLPQGGATEALGLDPAVWCVYVGYSKGILSSSRYTIVTVIHRPSGRERRASFYAAGKAAARRDAAAIARRLVKELEAR